MKKLISLWLIFALLLACIVPATSTTVSAYPDIAALQNDDGTFINMNGGLICELAENRYLRFRSTNADDNWIGSECRGADLCIAYNDAGVKGIVVDSADFTNNENEGWFEIAIKGHKSDLDCNVEYSVRGTWLPECGKFKYTYTTSMDANLEKWYQNSKVSSNYYNQNPNSTAPIEVADYHVENISNPDINNSDSYQHMSQRYEWFLSSTNGNDWEKFPKVYIPYPTRSGDYVTIRKVGERCYEGAKFGFADSKHGGWISTILDTTAGINFELCWYFFDVHMIMYNAVPKRYSSERFEISFAMDFEPVSAEDGNKLVDKAIERDWRSLNEYALPLFTRNNTFDTLISDDVIPSEETANHYIWWASSNDCYRDDTMGYDDKYSVSIKRTGKPTQPVAWNTYTWGRPFEKQSTGNHRYRLSAMVKTQDCTGAVRLAYGAQKNHADLFYGVGTHNSNGTPREDIIRWQYSDALTGTNDWTPVSMEFVVDYYVNSIILEMNGAGQCWFDNVVIEDLGEITADSYYVYDHFEDGKNDNWTLNSSAAAVVEDGSLVLEQAENATTFARAERGVKGYGGRWIAEMDASATTKVGTILAAAGVFNIEISGSVLLVKSGDSSFNRIDTKFDKKYVPGAPIKLKVIMDFDTKDFELWYNGAKVDLGVGNHIRSGTIEKLSSFLAKVDLGYDGNVTIDRFMLYPDSDAGSVNVSREALGIDEVSEHKSDIELPTEGINGATIEWSTSDATVVTAKGDVLRGNELKHAVLTALISKNNISDAKKFNIKLAPFAGMTFTADELISGAASTSVKVNVADDSAKIYINPVVMMACYSGGKLAGFDANIVDLGIEGKEYTLNALHQGKVDCVKIYLMENNNLRPVAPNIVYNISAQYLLKFDQPFVQTGDTVWYQLYELIDGEEIPVESGTYTLSCPGMTTDYDKQTVSFATGGAHTVVANTPYGMGSAQILVNDKNDKVAVKGSTQFDSDFDADNALATYYTANGSAFGITTGSDGKNVLSTAGSNTSDTLLFGPELTNYAVDVEFTPIKSTGSGVNTIAIGMRAKSANDRSSYRVTMAERWRFDGTNVAYNRLAAGRSNSSNVADGYYADYSDEPFAAKLNYNQKYKLSASICGEQIMAVLYDCDGNVLDSISSLTSDCDFNKNGTPLSALKSGKTLISFHCLVAHINDIRIYDYDDVGEIQLKASADNITVGETIDLTAFAGENAIDVGMAEFSAVSGFEINERHATATETGNHAIIAKYIDYAGKIKYAVTYVNVN